MFMQDATRFVAAAAIPAGVLATPAQSGLVAATLVETADGWRSAETLRRGDRLFSFDGGLRDIIAVDRAWLAPGSMLLTLPGGILNNAGPLSLLAGQHLLVDTWTDATLPGTVTVLIPAEALVLPQGAAWQTITAPTEVVTPVFAEEEVIYANGGLLLHCPGAASGPGQAGDDSFFHRLDLIQARALMRRSLRRAA